MRVDNNEFINNLIDFIINEFSIDVTENTRRRSVVQLRGSVVYCARKYTSISYTKLKGYFGIKEHASLINYMNNIESWLDHDDDFKMAHSYIESHAIEMIIPAEGKTLKTPIVQELESTIINLELEKSQLRSVISDMENAMSPKIMDVMWRIRSICKRDDDEDAVLLKVNRFLNGI
jgi:hypothetical protein